MHQIGEKLHILYVDFALLYASLSLRHIKDPQEITYAQFSKVCFTAYCFRAGTINCILHCYVYVKLSFALATSKVAT